MTASSARPFSASESDAGAAGPPLAPGEVHLWLCHRADAADSLQFRRAVLSRYAPLAPADWRFREGRHGKPRLYRPPRALDFNISHSGDWLVCAITPGVPVGVDLESVAARRDTLRLARRFFAPAEVQALQALPAARRREYFYDLWTLKEAAVKATGAALGPALAHKEFAIAFAGGAASGRIRPRFADRAGRGCFCLLRPLPHYCLALCSLAPIAALRLFRLAAKGEYRELSPALRAGSRSCTPLAVE